MTDRRQRAEQVLKILSQNGVNWHCSHDVLNPLDAFARDIEAAVWEEAVTILNKFEHEGWDRERTIKAVRQCFQAKVDYP